jgi:snRNA-activating protein complex subunit 3
MCPPQVAGEGGASHVDWMPLPETPVSHGGPLAVAQRQHFSTGKMESTKIRDLTLRVGATYVYAHQGDCEHALRCTDIRLATAEELEAAPSFPVTTHKLQRQQRKCAICEAALAAKVVYDSRLAPETPCFFCQECFQVRGCMA